MAKKVYTLREKENTDELHLFEGEMKPDGGCTANRESVCTEMSYNEGSRNKFACKDEHDARKMCAEIGRAVCGTCVSHLYATYKK